MAGIDYILTGLDNFLDKPSEEYPPIKAMSILKDYFIELNIPLKYIGKIKLDIDSEFFDDEEKARMVLNKLALVIMRTRNIILDGYGEDAEKIFADVIAGTTLTCRLRTI